MEIEEFCEKFLGVKLHPIQIEMVKEVTGNEFAKTGRAKFCDERNIR